MSPAALGLRATAGARFLAHRAVFRAPTPYSHQRTLSSSPLARVPAFSSSPILREPSIPASLTDAVDPEELGSSRSAASSSPSSSSATPTPAPPPFIESLSETSPDASGTDWSKSYHGLSSQPFSAEIAEILQAPLDPNDVEIKPDGIIYLPEIKYRRILNKAFGPGGWGLAPRSETNVGPKIVSREYALVCLGRLVGVARGEQEFFDPNGIPTATEGCKSNALMRCCKDIGVASELWDPRFIREFKKTYAVEAFVEHVPTKRKRKLWRRKDASFDYPYKE